MDLSSVKTAVKSWEKEFRASNGRAPTKEDIKSDPSDIASKYALYRKLSKSDSSSSQSSQSRPASSSTSASLSAGTSITSVSARSSQNSRSTPRIIPANEYPTTPTPPSRKSTQTPSVPIQPLSLSKDSGASSKNLKRTASKALLNGHPASPPRSGSGLASFLTPKKAAYSGPIHDPNPINPFSATPTKPSPIAGPGPSSAARASKDAVSPFIHASSPRKLREVLEANSLRRVKERESPLKEITPRTRARKRLRGEAVDDTPMKDKGPRRRRGEGAKGSNGVARPSRVSPPSGTVESFGERAAEEDTEGDDEDEDDELGPSPMKPSAFTALLTEHDSSDRNGQKGKGNSKLNPTRSNGVALAKGKSGQNDIRSMFAKSSRAAPPPDAPLRSDPSPGPPKPATSPTSLYLAPPADGDESADRLSTPLPDTLPDNDAPDVPSTSARPQRILTIEEDSVDEWDPEGGNAQRQLVIVPTRQAARPRHSSDEWDSSDDHADDDDAESPELVTGQEEEPISPAHGFRETATAKSPSKPFTPSLLSTLSLQSPHRRGAKSQLRDDNLRVQAIFDPLHATRLKAIRRGQDVYEAGEAGAVAEEQGEDEVLQKYDAGLGESETGADGDVYADDDWESENEGWKRSVGGMSDDEGW